jgi:hypothetical protein
MELGPDQPRLDFSEAIAALTDGSRITKIEWDNPDIYGMLRNGVLMLHLEDGWHKWEVNDGDLTGTDWIELD